MEGCADTKDYGCVQAWSTGEAEDIIGWQVAPHEKERAYRNWGLTARKIRSDLSKIQDI